MSTALIKSEQNMSLAELREYGTIMYKSGAFKDVGSAERAIVKMEIARSLGLPFMDGLRSIHIFDGKIELGSGIVSSLIKRSGKYNYHVMQLSEDGCAIQFTEITPTGEKLIGWQLGDARPKDCGVSIWTKEDTKRAGLEKKDNHAKYPKAMNYSRALTQGARMFCPDIFGGTVYAIGEISNETPDDVACESVIVTSATTISSTPATVATSSSPPTTVTKPADDTVDVPFEPAPAKTAPAAEATAPANPPKSVADLTHAELVERAKSLVAASGLTTDQAKRLIARFGNGKLADQSEETLRKICCELADEEMKRSMEAAIE